MSGRRRPKSDGVLAPSAAVRVERAAQDLRRGLPVYIGDDGGGRIVCLAAELATQERITALRSWSVRDLDLALTHQRAATLKIRLYTPDLVRVPITTEMGADDVRGLADPTADLERPLRGPFTARRDPFPDAARAAIRLAKIARLLPSVVMADIGTDGASKAFTTAEPGIAVAAAQEIHEYDVAAATALKRVTAARVPLAGAENARIVAFRPHDGGVEHLAIVIGDPTPPGPVLIRLHSECFTGDLLGSLKCDCGQQLRGAIERIAEEGAGILLYLAQEGRGIGLINKLRAYALQDQGFDTVDANERLGFEADERLFLPAAEMLRQMGFDNVRLMTNNPDKVAALETFGITVTERVPHAFPENDHNQFYLRTKADKSGHLL